MERFTSRPRQRAALAVVVALVALAAVAVYAATASPYDSAAVTRAALDAIEQQYAAAQAGDTAQIESLFTGEALSVVAPMRDQVQRNMASGSDYPGALEVTDPKVIGISGDANHVTLDLAVHEKLANMRGGFVVDYSQSDVIYRLVLDDVGGRWLVSSIDWTFAPGGGP